MTRKLKGRAFLCAGLILACISCTPPESSVSPSPGATQASESAGAVDSGSGAASQTKQQTATVRLGAIAESVAASGRVGGLDEVPLSLPIASRVLNVPVEQGEAVAEGQALLEIDSSAIEREIGLSRERLSEATARVEKAQASAQADLRRVKEAQQRALAMQRRAADDVQAKLRHAMDELSLLRAGPPANEILSAEGAVIAAQATLQRAQSDLSRAQAGPEPIELKTAEQEVLVATVAQRKAEADLERLRSGADPFVVSKYESELLTAQNGLEVAKSQFEAATRGPDPLAVGAVERQIQSIQIDLDTYRRAKIDDDDKNARLAKNANIKKLELARQAAEEQLARLKTGPDPNVVQLARRNVELAERNVRDAIERLRIARQGPDQMTLTAASAAVEATKAGVEKAQRKVELLQAGPTPEQIDALKSTVAAAQTAVMAAEARLAEVRNPRVRGMQIRDAEQRVAALQAQVDDLAQLEAAAPAEEDDADQESPVVVAAQKAVTQEQIALQGLEKALADARMVAPFPGVVTAVLARTGETVRPGRPAIILSRNNEPVVRVDLPERDADRIAAGQQAAVQIENAPSKLDAVVSSVVDQGGARVGLLKVSWSGDDRPVFGTRAQAAIQVRRKEQVLLVPQSAIRSIGGRRYVEVVEGGSTRRVDVEIGMAADGNVEILNGLREGQQVVLAS
jgi:RND family efflux transporter MFP subunit